MTTQRPTDEQQVRLTQVVLLKHRLIAEQRHLEKIGDERPDAVQACNALGTAIDYLGELEADIAGRIERPARLSIVA